MRRSGPSTAAFWHASSPSSISSASASLRLLAEVRGPCWEPAALVISPCVMDSWDRVGKKRTDFGLYHFHPADYPWRFKGASFNDNIIKWLYFPDFIVRPNPVFLVCKCWSHRATEHGLDFSLLIFLCVLCIRASASSNALGGHVKACLDASISQVLNGFYWPYSIAKLINKDWKYHLHFHNFTSQHTHTPLYSSIF